MQAHTNLKTSIYCYSLKTNDTDGLAGKSESKYHTKKFGHIYFSMLKIIQNKERKIKINAYLLWCRPRRIQICNILFQSVIALTRLNLSLVCQCSPLKTFLLVVMVKSANNFRVNKKRIGPNKYGYTSKLTGTCK